MALLSEIFMFVFTAACAFAAGWFTSLHRSREAASEARGRFFKALRRLRRSRVSLYSSVFGLGYEAAITDVERCARKMLVRPSDLTGN